MKHKNCLYCNSNNGKNYCCHIQNPDIRSRNNAARTLFPKRCIKRFCPMIKDEYLVGKLLKLGFDKTTDLRHIRKNINEKNNQKTTAKKSYLT